MLFLKKLQLKFLSMVFIFCCLCLPELNTRAETIYDSPYVDFSPNGQGWTVQAGDKDYTHYPEGTTINTGLRSTLRSLQRGEHYYAVERTGSVPIGKWVVEHPYAQCIHHDYPEGDTYLGLKYGTSRCFCYYNSGWIAYCADCGDEIRRMYVYMDREGAESIDHMECGLGLSYYHLCPHCNNLEQGARVREHTCKQISWNRYRVKYDANADDNQRGIMNPSFHMYNHETVYEGNPVTPVTHLTKNSYSLDGYEFIGWNTRPDGSGKFFADGAYLDENLSEYDYGQNEELATVTLYAQWKKSESTLFINPNDGAYAGSTENTVVKQEYNTKYYVDDSLVTPPEGYTVTFIENGGSEVEDTVSTLHFAGWSQEQPFEGKFINSFYLFTAPDGNEDTLVANYEPDSITLPETERKNWSFGGWYYDAKFTKPAGASGDEITPSKDLTLYAQWVELKLYSKNNYEANNKKGAVDLWWTQKDGKNKVYKLYQSLDEETWTPVYTANDIGSGLSVSESFTYSGEEKTYTVPYTGLYTLTAHGAQGGSFGKGTNKKTGGLGGEATGTFWLTKGDVITYNIGSQKGYGGGGMGDTYGANGGGCTTVTSKQHGLLLVAGGGGGASSEGNGGSGGSKESIRTDKAAAGEDGQAGGGAGYEGGTAGEVLVHNHIALGKKNSCYEKVDAKLHTPTVTYQGETYGTSKTTGTIKVIDSTDNNEIDMYTEDIISIGSAAKLIPVKKGDNVKLEAIFDYNNQKGDLKKGTNGFYIYNQEGTKLYQYAEADIETWVKEQTKNAAAGSYNENASFADGKNEYTSVFKASFDADTKEYQGADIYWLTWDANGNAYKNSVWKNDGTSDDEARAFYHSQSTTAATTWWYSERKEENTHTAHGSRTIVFRDNFTVADDVTTGIYIVFDVAAETVWSSDFTCAHLTGEPNLICGYDEGEVISSKPAYGGSNYINTDLCIRYESEAGKQTGNGSFSIVSEDIGYLDELRLDGVAASDCAAPEAVRTEGISEITGEKVIIITPIENTGGTQVKVTWTEPEDRGTTYYHMVESHMASTATKLCTSNIRENTLTTGVFGYYYCIDDYDSTEITVTNGTFTGKDAPWAFVTLTGGIQYLHIAPVDVAGNLGETSHVSIGIQPVEWPPHTRQLSIDSGDNVYPAELANTWYVRADDATPFTLQFAAYIEGNATDTYQINQNIFESQMEGCEDAWSIVETPMHAIGDSNIETDASGLFFGNTGASVLKNYIYTKTVRSNFNQVISVENQFLIGAETHGKLIRLTPRAGVVSGIYNVYSDFGEDSLNGIHIIGDAEAPIIQGMDVLDGVEVIDRAMAPFILDLKAQDDESGIKDFYVEIFNTDNVIGKTYEADGGGNISIDLAEDDPIFSGDFSITVTAVDNVGNKRTITHQLTELALDAEIKRILAPHEPNFKRGESGILTITTWGYMEKVEIRFPDELTALAPELNQTYVFEIPEYKHEEQQQFMIPLYVPLDGEYTITVKAYKGEKQLEAHPTLNIEGTVLDEIRTRLR